MGLLATSLPTLRRRQRDAWGLIDPKCGRGEKGRKKKGTDDGVVEREDAKSCFVEDKSVMIGFFLFFLLVYI